VTLRFDRVGLVGALALGAWARVTAWPKVFVAGEVFPQGGDSAYHLRRSLLTAESWPTVPVHDPWMNWPDGGPCHWAPGLDFLVGTLVRGLGLDAAAGSVLAMFVPVALGLLAVLAGWTVARRLWPSGPGAVFVPTAAAVALALIPQSEAVGRVGRLDHHVAEVLCMALLGLWVLAAPTVKRRALWEGAGAAILAGGLAFFAGSVLYAAVAGAMLLAVAWTRRDPGPVGLGAPAFGVAAGACAALYSDPVGGAFSYVFPSRLQPLLLLLGAVVLALVPVLRRAGRRGLVGVLLLPLAVFALPGARDELAAGLVGWLGRQDPWLAAISEFQPILTEGPGVRALLASPGLLAVVTVPLALRELVRRDRTSGLLFAGWTVAMVALTLWQLRFGRLFAVNLAICTAIALWVIAARADRRAAVATGLLVLLVALSPGLRKPLVLAEARALAPIEEASLALRPAPGEGAVPGTGAGVFVPWHFGHPILQFAKRPVVATGFGTYLDVDGFREVAEAPYGSEAELVAWMARRDLGFAVAGAATILQQVRDSRGRGPLVRGADGAGRLDPAYFAEIPLGTLLIGGSAVPGVAPHLERLRPVFASTAAVAGTALLVPNLWAYERVPGRILEGTGPPGAPVLARIELTVGGRTVPWFATGTVGADGAWRLRVPVEPGAHARGVRVGPEFVVAVGDSAPAPHPL